VVESDKYLSKPNERDESMKEYFRVDFVHAVNGRRKTEGIAIRDTLEGAQAAVEAWGPRFRKDCRIVRVTEETIK